jgi:hypothetical protein
LGQLHQVNDNIKYARHQGLQTYNQWLLKFTIWNFYASVDVQAEISWKYKIVQKRYLNFNKILLTKDSLDSFTHGVLLLSTLLPTYISSAKTNRRTISNVRRTNLANKWSLFVSSLWVWMDFRQFQHSACHTKR